MRYGRDAIEEAPMPKTFLSRLSYANIVATMALFLALGGTSYALIVDGGMVRDESLTDFDILNGSLDAAIGGNAINSPKVADNSLTGADVNESTLVGTPVSGLQWTSAQSPSNSDAFKAVVAQCPPGKKLTGSGHDVVGVPWEYVRVVSVLPWGSSVGTSAVRVAAYEVRPTSGWWEVRAYAICANAN